MLDKRRHRVRLHRVMDVHIGWQMFSKGSDFHRDEFPIVRVERCASDLLREAGQWHATELQTVIYHL
jgi:hypothetical protein